LKVNIVSLKAPFHAQKIAETNNFNFFSIDKILLLIDKNKNKFKNHSLIIIGFYLRYKQNKDLNYIYELYKKIINAHNNVIIVFAGSDVLHFKNLNIKDRLRFFNLTKNIYAVGENLKNEILNDLNYESKILHLPFNHSFDELPPNLPKSFAVGCYMPTNRTNFYGYDYMLELVKICPDVKFYFYANDGFIKNKKEELYKNLISIESSVDNMSLFLKNISCGIRYTEHDGNPMTLAEYCANGRSFFYNREMPFCELIDHDVKVTAEKILNMKENYNQNINFDMLNFYRDRHNKDKFINSLNKVFK
jgi:hypothetical protein